MTLKSSVSVSSKLSSDYLHYRQLCISTLLTSRADRRFLSGCGGAHAAFGACSAERCSGDRTVSSRLTGHFLHRAAWTAMALGAEIATGPIGRSGTGAAAQTHMSAGTN